MIKIFFFITFFGNYVFSQTNEIEKFRLLIHEQFQRYPEMQIQDMYKFVHQSAMGNAHAGVTLEMAQNYLEQEIQNLSPSDSIPLFENLSFDSTLIRVNLSPFIFYNRDIQELAKAFVQTTEEFEVSEKLLQERLNLFLEMSAKKEISFLYDDVKIFVEEKRKQNYPAVHHSFHYRKQYSPAYRVILKKFLE